MSKNGMEYEKTGTAKIKNVKGAVLSQIDDVSTASVMWYLVKRHKVGLLGTWAVLITVLYLFPPLPDMIFKVLGR